MIYSYGITQIGPYHIKNNIVCQDAHYIMKISDQCVIAAVADGLGSECYSDTASKIASQTAVEYCAERYSPDLSDEDVNNLIAQAFRISQCMIEETCQKNRHEITDYDTTLDLVIFNSGLVYFGHAGDSGIIVQTDDGLYAPLTTQDRDEMGRVFPLCFEERWTFGKAEKNVASVMLCTDGIFEIIFPFLLRDQNPSIYVALAQFFMDGEQLGFEENGEDAVRADMTAFIENLQESQVNDDKTVVVLCDTSIRVTRQDETYYAVPDWERLTREHREKFFREAYPHMADKDLHIAAAQSDYAPESKTDKSIECLPASDNNAQLDEKNPDAQNTESRDQDSHVPEPKHPLAKKLMQKLGKKENQ